MFPAVVFVLGFFVCDDDDDDCSLIIVMEFGVPSPSSSCLSLNGVAFGAFIGCSAEGGDDFWESQEEWKSQYCYYSIGDGVLLLNRD